MWAPAPAREHIFVYNNVESPSRPELNEKAKQIKFSLNPADNQRLASLCGHLDENIKQIEGQLGVQIANRGNVFHITGQPDVASYAKRLLKELYDHTGSTTPLTPSGIHMTMQHIKTQTATDDTRETQLRTPKMMVRARTPRQGEYIRQILTHDINFGIGPAGTGKTYLAVACAIDALERDQVQRIVLVRPAVEAGERLGFLPGDVGQKVDPYLRPLYDALHEMLGPERVARLMEKNVIELAPLAYMRGRTLNDAFIILDEAQNTTIEQMKMFLTRIGFGSTAVITGDITQVDLPRAHQSGLRQAIEILRDVDGISFMYFTPQDVVRHPLVQKIVEAYERHGQSGNKPPQ